MIAPATLGRKINFIGVVGTLSQAQSSLVPYHHDETIYDYSYTNVRG